MKSPIVFSKMFSMYQEAMKKLSQNGHTYRRLTLTILILKALRRRKIRERIKKLPLQRKDQITVL